MLVTRNWRLVPGLLASAGDDDVNRKVLVNSGKHQAILAKTRGELDLIARNPLRMVGPGSRLSNQRIGGLRRNMARSADQ